MNSTIVRRDRFFVISGGPGAGKTTLIHELRRRGVGCVDEVARDIIRNQMKIGGRALPWVDPALFAELMLHRDVANYLAADAKTLVVFDRGIVDSFAYYTEVAGFAPPGHLRATVSRLRYNPLVFVAPPWEEIYTTDAERRQDYAEAVRVHAAVMRAYGAAGYSLVALPLAGVEERAEFVLERMRSAIRSAE